MILPGFKNSTTYRSVLLDAAVRLTFSKLFLHFKSQPLEKISIVSSGGTPSRNSPEYYGGSIPWVKISDISAAGKWICETEEMINDEGLKNSSAVLFPENTVLFSMYGSVGKTAITKCPLTTNQAILGLTPLHPLTSEYLYYSLILAREALFSRAKGTSQKNINGKMVKKFQIPIIPDDLSKDVVNFLSAIEDERDLSAISVPPILEEIKDIIVTLERLLTKIEEVRKERLEVVEYGDSILMRQLEKIRKSILEKYLNKKIGEIFEVTSGGTPSREISIYWNGDIPWIKTGELLDNDIFAAEEYITNEGLKCSAAKLFPKETILIALYGQGQTRGRTARLMIKATTNQACCAILPQPEIMESRFLQYWLRGLYYEMRENYRDGAQPNWNGKMIKEIIIAIPPLSEQRLIIVNLERLQAKVDEVKRLHTETEREMEALVPAVLAKAF